MNKIKEDEVIIIEMVVPSQTKPGQLVVYGGKRYKMIKIIDSIKENSALCVATGEYIEDYNKD